MPLGPAIVVPRSREFAGELRRAGCPALRQPGWPPLQCHQQLGDALVQRRRRIWDANRRTVPHTHARWCSAKVDMDEDRLKLRECLEGNPEALAFLRSKYQSPLTTALLRRGASPTEAEDLLADLWGDCVVGEEGHPSLLEKYSGRCAVKAWLVTVATNRLFDLKRKLRFRGEATGKDGEGRSFNLWEGLSTPMLSLKESALQRKRAHKLAQSEPGKGV